MMDFSQPLTASDYLRRGQLYLEEEVYEAALTAFNAALVEDPDFTDAYLARGTVYYILNRYAEALADFSRVSAVEPDNIAAYTNRGAVYTDLGRYAEALADYFQLLDIRPGLGLANYRIAGVYARQGEAEQTLEYLGRALTESAYWRDEARRDTNFDNVRQHPLLADLLANDEAENG